MYHCCTAAPPVVGGSPNPPRNARQQRKMVLSFILSISYCLTIQLFLSACILVVGSNISFKVCLFYQGTTMKLYNEYMYETRSRSKTGYLYLSPKVPS